MAIKDEQALTALLRRQGIDTTLWGVNSSKRVADLWQEMVLGETELQHDPLLRVVSVVQVLILRGDRVLLEVEQTFQDGRVRQRHQPPSDKMKPGEAVEVAALRCLAEELSIAAARVQLRGHSYQQTEEIKESPSYPGLKSCYRMHTITADVAGLPETDFWTEETATNSQDPIQHHHWAWVPLAEVG